MDTLKDKQTAIIRARQLAELSRSNWEKAQKLVWEAKRFESSLNPFGPRLPAGADPKKTLPATDRKAPDHLPDDWAFAFRAASRGCLPKVSSKCFFVLSRTAIRCSTAFRT